MNIITRGLTRYVYTHTLNQSDLTEIERSNDPIWDGLYVNEDSGDLTISWTCRVTLNGRYGFDMRLSRDEIARLFAEAMSNLPFEKVVELLGVHRSARPSAT